MKKSIIFIVVAMLCLLFKAYGQGLPIQNIKPLAIGDKVPEIVFEKILNGNKQPISLSSLKGKAVILDFWATWCSACIKGFPHMQELQQKYGKNLQVLLIGDSVRDTEEKLTKFLLDREKDGSPLTLPVAYNDLLTKLLFPHKMFPHYVWIGADRRVKAITRGIEVTDINVDRFVAGLELSLPKKDL
ncbi:thiol-disulfide isomerase/thioredoxin [Pedobacter sp. W3I1]|uniref:TlpA family protein disulfide reductase n=1 Tax=Pedobacter sp. W3I1 TaxID=3042291 RepID=UPI0027832849|nr:TlpA disulfide reductase family protein [Pedobacter sp. W3I1]MDQ0640182.1 thiol-disulfide isomerase/thioredoxin [Pedobacter sp. W3I1]